MAEFVLLVDRTALRFTILSIITTRLRGVTMTAILLVVSLNFSLTFGRQAGKTHAFSMPG